MSEPAPIASRMVCAGCGHEEPADAALTFRCPRAVDGDDIDHVLVSRFDQPNSWAESTNDDPNPFIRYRTRFHTWHLARRGGLSDADYVALVRDADGRAGGFAITPYERNDELAVWIKNETGNLSGSHKARHLFGVALHLRVAAELGHWRPDGARLAIASCGNAALAAAVVAPAIELPLDVFIPTWANPNVIAALEARGANLIVCERNASDPPGDPCYYAFRRAVAAGALPFTCQGNENGLAIDGGRTLAWELVDQHRAASQRPLDAIAVQVGGGALASAVAQGLASAVQPVPTLYAVQTANAHPLRVAWRRLVDSGEELAVARRKRSHYMQPWPTPPESIATGILDDETYDWAAVCEALRETGGDVVLADEPTLTAAQAEARAASGIDVSATGAAGLAGVLRLRHDGKLTKRDQVAVLFTGKQR